MKLWSGLLMVGVGLLAGGVIATSPDLLGAAAVAGAASVAAYIVGLRMRIGHTSGDRDGDKRFSDIEQRLTQTESELETTRVELRRLRDAQDFDLKLSRPDSVRHLSDQYP